MELKQNQKKYIYIKLLVICSYVAIISKQTCEEADILLNSHK